MITSASQMEFKFLYDNIVMCPRQAQLSKQAGHLLVSLGAAMQADSAPACRAAAAACIEAMLLKFPQAERNKLFDLVLTFFKDNQVI